MSFRAVALTVLVALLGGLGLLWGLQRELSRTWLAFGSHPEVVEQLEAAREDQRRLAEADPRREGLYRQRFDEVQTLIQRLRILEHNRDAIRRRYELVLLGLFTGVLAFAGAAHLLGRRRYRARLERLRRGLEDLAVGRTDLRVEDRRRDTIGRIGAMIEQISRVMARDRRRLAALGNLSAWQEAARRHAHEMRTPLTGAGLELSRLDSLLEGHGLDSEGDIRQAARSARQELEHLRRFTREFTSFGRLPRPRPREADLRLLLEEFVATYAAAWPGMRLELEGEVEEGLEGEPLRVRVDRDLLRQVLVNLCDNSYQASARAERSTAAGPAARGTVRLVPRAGGEYVALRVSDDGPGIEETVRARLFEPYTTTRGIGEGMGLGLAICKKILLDHGGDLDLEETSSAGTTFRLSLPHLSLPHLSPGRDPECDPERGLEEPRTGAEEGGEAR